MENVVKKEFEKYFKKWTIKDNRYLNGIDVGCGTSRIDEMITSVDIQADYRFAHAQLVWDCKDLEIFNDNSLDFIFSSHCLEDFDNIPEVFKNWWKKIKPNGHMLLILPDMESCDCDTCKEKQEYRKKNNMSARYWTIEDHKKSNKGNPSHRSNVGKKFMTNLLQSLLEKGIIKYEILQMDTIPHNESCSIDFVIKKIS